MEYSFFTLTQISVWVSAPSLVSGKLICNSTHAYFKTSEASQLSKMATSWSKNCTFSSIMFSSSKIHPIFSSLTNKKTHSIHQIPREQKVEETETSNADCSNSITYNFTFCCSTSGTCLAWICTNLEGNCSKDRIYVIFPSLRPHHPWKSGFNGTSSSTTTAEMGPCVRAKQQLSSFRSCDILLSWERFHVQG